MQGILGKIFIPSSERHFLVCPLNTNGGTVVCTGKWMMGASSQGASADRQLAFQGELKDWPLLAEFLAAQICCHQATFFSLCSIFEWCTQLHGHWTRCNLPKKKKRSGTWRRVKHLPESPEQGCSILLICTAAMLGCLGAKTSHCFQQIYYWESDVQNDTEKVKVLFLPETTVRLKNLTSHTRYLVCISAFNAAGDGPRSRPSTGRTHQAGMWPPQSTGLMVAGSKWCGACRRALLCRVSFQLGRYVVLAEGKGSKMQQCGKGSREMELEQMVRTTDPFAGRSRMQLWGSLWGLCYQIWKSELVSSA